MSWHDLARMGLRRFSPAILFSLGFGLCTTVGLQIHFEDISGGVDSTYFAWWPLTKSLLVGALLVIGSLVVVVLFWRCYAVSSAAPAPDGSGKFPLGRFALIVLVLLLCWVPYYLALYPGVVVPDTIASIEQIRGDAPLSNHHPVVFTLILGVFVRAFPGDINHGIFAFAMMQSCVMAMTLSYLICRVSSGRYGRVWVVLSILFFGLSPVFPIYALNVQKDTLFSCVLALFSFELWSEMRKPGRLGHVLLLGALAVGVSVLRGNGVYVATASLAILLVVRIRNKLRLRDLVAPVVYALVVFLAIPLAMTGRVLPTQESESMGIPLQQIARTIVVGGDISSEDRAFLYRILPEDGWSEYSPTLVDNIKWDPRFDDDYLAQNKAKFLVVWLRTLQKNPSTYAEAYTLQTFGFWVPGAKNGYGFMDAYVVANGYGIQRTNYVDRWLGFPLMRTVVNSATFFGSGTLLWFGLLGLVLLLMENRMSCVLFLLPALLCVATILVATPVAFSLRYVFVMALLVPFFLSVALRPSAADSA